MSVCVCVGVYIYVCVCVCVQEFEADKQSLMRMLVDFERDVKPPRTHTRTHASTRSTAAAAKTAATPTAPAAATATAAGTETVGQGPLGFHSSAQSASHTSAGLSHTLETAGQAGTVSEQGPEGETLDAEMEAIVRGMQVVGRHTHKHTYTHRQTCDMHAYLFATVCLFVRHKLQVHAFGAMGLYIVCA